MCLHKKGRYRCGWWDWVIDVPCPEHKPYIYPPPYDNPPPACKSRYDHVSTTHLHYDCKQCQRARAYHQENFALEREIAHLEQRLSQLQAAITATTINVTTYYHQQGQLPPLSQLETYEQQQQQRQRVAALTNTITQKREKLGENTEYISLWMREHWQFGTSLNLDAR